MKKRNDILSWFSLTPKQKRHQTDKLFGFAEKYRSDSDKGQYAACVEAALKDQRSFDNFKRNEAYRGVLEHVSEAQGATYLEIASKRDEQFFEQALSSVLVSDEVGNPVKFSYPDINVPLSPTTLRYVKVASDLKLLFGEGIDRVAEIGCGYGGQCLVNERLLGYRYATLFDLPVVNELISRYLNYTLMRGAFEVASINEKLPMNYDLVISNYAFSELPKELQQVYVDKVLSNSARGYLTMNSGAGGERSAGKLTLDELRDLLPTFEIIQEQPKTSKHNYIIVWGHEEGTLGRVFQTDDVVSS